MLLSAPLFGQTTPARIRIFFAGLFAACITPMLLPTLPTPPADMVGLFQDLILEIAVGLIIGLSIQILLLGAQMAGAFMDMQLGFQMMQMFNPMAGGATTLMGQFKFLLFLVMILIMDGHHMMLQAMVESYQLNLQFDAVSLESIRSSMVGFIASICVLSLQIAAPVAAVSFVVDAAAGVVNKSIPQMPVYMVTMGAKTAMGITAIALGLPLMAVAVRSGLDHTGVKIVEILSHAAR